MIVYRYNEIGQQLEYMANNNCGFANDQGILKGTLSHDKNFKYVEDFTPLNTAS